MKSIISIVSVLLLVGLVAFSMPVAADDGADVGVCVIGVDSPCNGESVDGGADPHDPVSHEVDEDEQNESDVEEPVPYVREPRGAAPDEDRTVSDGLPLAPEECVPGPATMCAPTNDTPTISEGLPLASDEECVPGPSTMCAPAQTGVVTDDGEVEPVNTSADLPEEAAQSGPVADQQPTSIVVFLRAVFNGIFGSVF